MQYIYSVFFVSIALNCIGQTATSDQIPSLELKLVTVTDSIDKLKLYNDLSYAWARNDNQKSGDFALKAIELASKLNSHGEHAKGLHQLGEYELKNGNAEASLISFEKSLDFSQKANDKILEGISYQKIGKWHQQQKQDDKAIFYYNKSIELRESIDDKKGLSSVYHNLLVMYTSKNDMQNAIKFGEKALSIRRDLGNQRDLSVTLRSYSNFLLKSGFIDEAIPLTQQSLEIATNLNDVQGQSTAITILGNIFLERADYKKALDYFLQAEKLNEKLNDSFLEASNKLYLAKVYSSLGDYLKSSDHGLKVATYCKQNKSPKNDEMYANLCTTMLMNRAKYGDEGGKHWFDEAMAIKPNEELKANLYFNYCAYLEKRKLFSEQLKYAQLAYDNRNKLDAITKALCPGQLGVALSRNGKSDEAIPFLEQAIIEMKDIGSSYEISKIRSELANILSQKNDVKSKELAIEEALKNLAIVKKRNVKPEIENAYYQLSSCYEAIGDKANTLKYLQLRNILKDSLITYANLESMAESELNTELNDSLSKSISTIQVNKTKLVHQTKYNKLILFYGIALLLSGLIFFISYKKRQKQKLETQEAEYNKQLADAELKLLLDRKRISQDLHDEVGSTLSSINILSGTQLTNLQSKYEEQRLQAIGENARSAMESISDIVWALNPANEAAGSLIERITYYAANTLEPLGMEVTMNIDKNIDDTILPFEIRKNIYLIFKEIVNNCAKYSKAQAVTISLQKVEDKINMSIDDNGIGFDTSNISDSLGNNGLKNIFERAKSIDGVMTTHSFFGEGTQIDLSVPLHVTS
jgi:two-component system, NarL family, sensor histidine kinase UhpB